MKELTIEQKAQRYDEAIEIAKRINNEQQAQPFNIMTRVFPELKESEDERIRKDIIVLIKDWWDRVNKDNISTKEQMLAWLEKQGKQKAVIIIPRFRVGDTIRIKNSNAEYTITEISDGYYRGKGWCLDIAAGDECGDYELVEQKPWSEEDERLKTSCIKHIEEELERIRNDKYGHSEIISDLKESCRERINWLESLKERCTWKPSDEKMKALSAINVTGGISYAGQGQELINLYNDLKKLTE